MGLCFIVRCCSFLGVSHLCCPDCTQCWPRWCSACRPRQWDGGPWGWCCGRSSINGAPDTHPVWKFGPGAAVDVLWQLLCNAVLWRSVVVGKYEWCLCAQFGPNRRLLAVNCSCLSHCLLSLAMALLRALWLFLWPLLGLGMGGFETCLICF